LELSHKETTYTARVKFHRQKHIHFELLI